MFTSYEEAMEWIHSRKSMGKKPGIKRMEWMMEKLNHPEKNFKSIHIAGTNGKGSTIAYLRSLFMEAGYSVGSYISPHIVSFNERFSVNGEPAQNEKIVELVNDIYPFYKEISRTELGALTEFEVVTAMMFHYFSECSCDVTLIEVGLGGLFDSTNIVEPDIAVITTIGKDHVKILGNTLSEIAYQKAGIIKAGTPVVVGKVPLEASQVISSTAKGKNAPVYEYRKDFNTLNWRPQQELFEKFDFVSETVVVEDISIPLIGKHQIENAAAALQSFLLFCQKNHFEYSQASIKRGFLKTTWPVRLEVFSKNPMILLDGAHNVPAIEALTETMRIKFAGRSITILLAVLGDKDIEEIGNVLKQMENTTVLLTTFDFPRASSELLLKKRLDIENAFPFHEWKEAVDFAKIQQKADEILLITGSLYFLSEVRHYLYKDR